MASTSFKVKEEPIEISSGDSEPEDHEEVEAEVELPLGREVRPGRFPFNPGFNIDITSSQSSARQTLVISLNLFTIAQVQCMHAHMLTPWLFFNDMLYYIHPMTSFLIVFYFNMKNVPAWFVRKWMSRKYSNVDLQTEDGKRYNVKLCWNVTRRFTCAYGGEWYDLVEDQNLDEGDNICVHATKYYDTYKVTVSCRRRH